MHAVRERLAAGRVVADREQLALAAEDDLLVRDEPGQPHGVDRRVAADQLRGRLRGARRRVLLRLVVELDDLGPREVLRPPRARSASSARRRSRSSARRRAAAPSPRASAPSSARVPARRADDARDALLERGADVRRRRVGRREVDGGVAAARRRARRRARSRAPRARRARARGDEPRARPSPPRRRTRSSRRGRARDERRRSRAPTAARNRASSGPTPDAESRSGGSSDGRELRELVRVDRVDLGDHPLERQELGVGDERLAEPAHAVRRRLDREHDPPLEALLRALELALAQLARRRSRAICSTQISTHGARFSSRVPT